MSRCVNHAQAHYGSSVGLIYAHHCTLIHLLLVFAFLCTKKTNAATHYYAAVANRSAGKSALPSYGLYTHVQETYLLWILQSCDVMT